MGHAFQVVRSALFIGQMYLAMAVIGIGFAPWALLSNRGARMACRSYSQWVRWTARWMVGLRSEVRGEVPTDDVLIAAKHQSFLDIILIYAALPRARFIMKQELLMTPIFGQYARRVGCIAVDRGKRGKAMKQMVAEVKQGRNNPGQLVIYAQGTRVAPGARLPYKVGAGVLYGQFGLDCVPAATNVGVFWPRRGLLRRPGLAVVEFLPRIPAGMPISAFMAKLESDIESASDRLMQEAGFQVQTDLN
ncbi:1-acyl-sn-glycerol-3-phosphate acyltransferase [Poseidonocella pacifica]|uniref:1-acyl-sn-glycerol-3-phosphate acyltransferase n=1 Tax=Poseidonocella pacifica TaxID=871651 RepID=A0A1I0WPM5_9RHOB|nr:lysophospholipid acyltransferase family protein [Poseidonocella pacifica]SFA90357.1 1-acyl-sn-glycerol-3-phosphate acyltransferase [Poseidonocella pacifica]